MSDELILKVSGLTKTFGEGEAAAQVLKGIDLTMASGEMAALLGPSGSAKSTLLTILGTLMRASGGSPEMLGIDLMHASDPERTEFRSKHLGFVFQFHHLLPDLTARENVMMPAAAAAGREIMSCGSAPPNCWRPWGSPIAETTVPPPCRVANASALPWRAHLSTIRFWFWPMSPPEIWIANPPTS